MWLDRCVWVNHGSRIWKLNKTWLFCVTQIVSLQCNRESDQPEHSVSLCMLSPLIHEGRSFEKMLETAEV